MQKPVQVTPQSIHSGIFLQATPSPKLPGEVPIVCLEHRKVSDSALLLICWHGLPSLCTAPGDAVSIQHNANSALRIVGYSSPGGWESEGPQMGGTGSSEKIFSYLATLGVPEPYPAVLAFWGQGTGSKVPSSRMIRRWQRWRWAA